MTQLEGRSQKATSSDQPHRTGESHSLIFSTVAILASAVALTFAIWSPANHETNQIPQHVRNFVTNEAESVANQINTELRELDAKLNADTEHRDVEWDEFRRILIKLSLLIDHGLGISESTRSELRETLRRFEGRLADLNERLEQTKRSRDLDDGVVPRPLPESEFTKIQEFLTSPDVQLGSSEFSEALNALLGHIRHLEEIVKSVQDRAQTQ